MGVAHQAQVAITGQILQMETSLPPYRSMKLKSVARYAYEGKVARGQLAEWFGESSSAGATALLQSRNKIHSNAPRFLKKIILIIQSSRGEKKEDEMKIL